MKMLAVVALVLLTTVAHAQTFADCRYTNAEQTLITCTVDRLTSTIPARPGNRHYDAIIARQIPIAPFEE
jgi:hypothetical protein